MLAIRQSFFIPKVMANTSSIVNRYINALLKSTLKDDKTDTVISELQNFFSIVKKSDEIAKILFNSVVPVRIKKEICENILKNQKFNSITVNFINTLLNNNRLHKIEEIISGLVSQTHLKKGFTEIVFETGMLLSDKDQKIINAELKDSLNCKPMTKFVHNDNMLGGFKVYYDSKMIDKSFRSKLNRIKKMLQSTELNFVEEAKVNK